MSPNVLLPSAAKGAAGAGGGADGDEPDEPAPVGLAAVLDDADGVSDDPQATSGAAARIATVAAAHRDTRAEITMGSRSVPGLSVRFGDGVRLLWSALTNR